MSIVPGPQAWRDAGLVDPDPDGWVDLDTDSLDRAGVVVGEAAEANDADVVEQAIALPTGDEDEYR